MDAPAERATEAAAPWGSRDRRPSVALLVHAAAIVSLLSLLLLMAVLRTPGGNDLRGPSALILWVLGLPWSLLAASVASPGPIGDWLVLTGSAIANLAIHGLLVWRARKSTATMPDVVAAANGRRLLVGVAIGLVTGAFVASVCSWFLPMYLILHDDSERGRRYFETLEVPDAPSDRPAGYRFNDRQANFVNVACQRAAEAIYDNVMFDDSRADWAPPNQEAFYDGCSEEAADPLVRAGAD